MMFRATAWRVEKAAAVTVSRTRPISLYRRADVEALAATRARPQRTPTERKGRR